MGRLDTLLRGPLGLWRVLGTGGTARSAILGSLAVSGGQVAVGALFALASLYLVRSFATPEYGRVAFGIYLYTLLQAVASLGLGTGVLAEVARGRMAEGVAWPTVHTLLWVRLLSAVPVVLVGLVWAALASDVVPAMASVVAATAILAEFLIGMLAGQLRTRAYIAVVVGQPAIYLLLLLVARVQTAEQALISLGGAICASLLLAVALLGRGPVARVGRPRATMRELSHALSVARSSYVLGALHIGFISMPVILLGLIDRFTEAAALSIVLALVRFAPEALGQGVQATYFPRLKAVDPRGADAAALFGTYARLLALLAIPAAIGLAVMGHPILGVLFGDRYQDLATPLAIACALVVLLPAESLLTWTLVARGEHRLALLGVAMRLVVVGVTSVVIAARTDTSPLLVVLVASVVGAVMSVAVQGARTFRTGPLRSTGPSIAVYALMTAVVYLGTNAALAGRAADLVTVLTAGIVTIPLLVAGAVLLRPRTTFAGAVS